jgi:hypothetical protein
MRSEANTPFGKFLKQWRDELTTSTAGWDGFRAIEELKRAGYSEGNDRRSMITFVRCDPDEKSRPLEMLRKVFAEVTDYKKRRRAWQKEFRDVDAFMAKLRKSVDLKQAETNGRLLKRLLSNTGLAIKRRHRILANFKSGSPGRPPLGPWERLWSQHARAEIINREIDLDTRLQVQCAKMFRIFLHEDEGVSLRTIARLVVLVYKASGLASEIWKDGFLRLPDSQRAITVRSVEEKLRRKGKHFNPTF